MSFTRLFPILLLPLALPACTSAPAPAPEPRFDAAEAAFMDKPGRTTITGQAFLPDKTGHVNARFAAGEVVRLIPATSYARARLSSYFRGAKFLPAASVPRNEPDPDYLAHMRTTKAGPTGRFVFENVPPGDYFISTQLTWRPEGAFVTEGGLIYEEATVTGAETKPVEVIVSGK